MQKLGIMNTIMNILKTERGSVLVASVVLSIIAGIAATGYLVVTNNTVTQEVIALDDARAFYAAESGLLIATRWLADTTNWTNFSNTGTMDYNLNGINVMVYLGPKNGNAIPIAAQASGGALKYTKELSWSARIKSGGQSMVINSPASVGPQGIAEVLFDGPAHFNGDLKLFIGGGSPSANPARFVNGPVTIHDSKFKYYSNKDPYVSTTPPYYNDYQYGVADKNGGFDINKFDITFQTLYMHSQPFLTSSVKPIGTTINLDVQNSSKAYLKFNGPNSADFFNGTGTQEIKFLDGDVFKVLNNQSIKVKGVVNGKTTVMTTGAGSITIDTSLIYANWSWDAKPYGVVISGTGDNAVYNYDNDFGLKSNSSQNVNMISLVASESGDIIVNVPNNSGASCIAGFLYTKSGKIDLQPDVNNLKRDIYLVGSRCANEIDEQFFNPGANGIAFLYDRRMIGDAFEQMGIELKTTSSNGNGGPPILVLDLNWTERNF